MISIDIQRLGRKITLILFTAQSLSSAGFIAIATLNSILGASLSGKTSWAGVPSAVYLLGAAGAAFLWGYLMDSLGRRGGLTLGLFIGTIGAGTAFVAISAHSLSIFLSGMLLLGMANAAMTLGRFAAAEVHPAQMRGRAISNVVLGGTVGAILGPLLVAPAGVLAQKAGFDELSGAYFACLALLSMAGLVIFTGLRPDPKDLGKALATSEVGSSPVASEARPARLILRQPPVIVAMLSMIIGQMVMVMVMVITSLHMKAHDHGLGDISLVISAHTLGMYAFSLISGRLADRLGRNRVILIGSLTLILACLSASLSPQLLPLAVALFLLGLGWNFCFVGGSALLADQLSPAERARIQGTNDLLVGLASMLGSLGSGAIYASTGFTVMTLIGAFASVLLMIILIGWSRMPDSRVGRAPAVLP